MACFSSCASKNVGLGSNLTPLHTTIRKCTDRLNCTFIASDSVARTTLTRGFCPSCQSRLVGPSSSASTLWFTRQWHYLCNGIGDNFKAYFAYYCGGIPDLGEAFIVVLALSKWQNKTSSICINHPLARMSSWSYSSMRVTCKRMISCRGTGMAPIRSSFSNGTKIIERMTAIIKDTRLSSRHTKWPGKE
jgi:hypothetical protein